MADTKEAGPRAAPRAEDPRARAAARAAAIREHLGDVDEGVDKFYIAPEDIPDGWDYEWKRRTVLNQEDPSYQVSLARKGWEPVPADRHPSFMPEGWTSKMIERDGMVLMERPKEISEEARRRDTRAARDQVKFKEEQLNATPEGTLPRTEDARTRAKIGKSYEAIPIPD